MSAADANVARPVGERLVDKVVALDLKRDVPRAHGVARRGGRTDWIYVHEEDMVAV